MERHWKSLIAEKSNPMLKNWIERIACEAKKKNLYTPSKDGLGLFRFSEDGPMGNISKGDKIYLSKNKKT